MRIPGEAKRRRACFMEVLMLLRMAWPLSGSVWTVARVPVKGARGKEQYARACDDPHQDNPYSFTPRFSRGSPYPPDPRGGTVRCALEPGSSGTKRRVPAPSERERSSRASCVRERTPSLR